MGLKPGDRVATLVTNSLASVEMFIAAHYSGVAIVPLNFRWNLDEVRYALEDCAPAVLIADQAFEGTALAAAEGRETRVYSVAGAAPDYQTLRADHEAQPLQLPSDSLFGIFYTGGTTGRSKGVMLSRGNLWSNVVACMAEGAFGEGEVGLHVSPLFHIAGALCLHCAFLSASRNIIMPAFDAGKALGHFERDQINQVLLVPTMLGAVLNHPQMATTNVSSLRNILYGAAPMTPTMLERAIGTFTKARFTQLYGMTETSPTATVLHSREYLSDQSRRGLMTSVGRPILGTEVRIMRTDGSEAARGEVGEICTRGPGVMLGYWNKPEATAEALQDGWMRTGDGGYMDYDGFVFLADRIKDMIITGGENVFSVEVECVLAMHPAVQQCAVVGIPHDHWGEQVHGVVVLHDGQDASEEELIAFCRERLSAFKTPRSIAFDSQALPVSAAGKILKRDIRARYWPSS
jgi:long-chain acyl-CoA synthetase